MAMIPERLPEHLLVVDDSELQRLFMVDLCRDMGIGRVYQAVDGFDAIAKLKANPQIDTLILDLEMPGMDGVQVLHELARMQLELAVIVASVRESTLLNVVESLGKSLGLRLLGVLQKPVLLNHLASSLSRFSAVQLRSECQEPPAEGPRLDQQDVKWALRNREFEVYFQPKLDLTDGRLTGAEALVRWHHPAHGLLTPNRFISLVEEGPHISELTLQVLELSLAHCQRWHAIGLPLSVSINVSARSLSDSLLAEQIIERVAASGVAPANVILEITESALMSDLSTTLGTLARLRLRGFGLSVDDYGTGFSCMLQLARIPCTELKIDRAFVNGASHSMHLRILLESALDIARKLSLQVVAEGVETLEDWILLRNLGCGQAQGYLLGRPMPGGELVAWWESNRTRIRQLAGRAG
ncbi:EAL domain-containing response regulator [Pseudomonas citronellolis]|uniref:EAL domain-containing response regulator n=1 Tax=Pseudomonas citronellolis TaxID=53408 RepID=UPI0023E3F335|nr:EAL domain-containing response regulator [Pseudomonas citronellolis]MDF3933761.1 EAL domain-containing response regulator [Pseudomonas citronellolis]